MTLDNIRPICLPSYSEWNSTWYHLDMQISGWGKPSDAADGISPVLRDATVDTITNTACALQFPINVDHRNICISGKDGTSTCNVRECFIRVLSDNSLVRVTLAAPWSTSMMTASTGR